MNKKATHTLYYYGVNKEGQLVLQYDIFTGTRYECYKIRNTKSFKWQYKVQKCKWY